MMKWLEKHADACYATTRIVVGGMFCFHGCQKILGVLSPFQPPVGSQLWIGGIIELFCGFAVMVGFQTRLAAFLCSGQMAVAYFQFHWKLQGGANFFPAINKGEPAVLYCFIFLLLASRGGVKWAVSKDT